MTTPQGKVLIAAPVHPVLLEGLVAAGYEPMLAADINQQIAYEWIADCVGVVTSTRLQLDAALIDAAPQLRWIGRMGSGMEVIDLHRAKERGITCFGSPDGNCNAVAEHALGMLLSLTKRITSSNAEVRQGQWLREANRGIELEGKTIGIIGLGHTGKAFARKLLGFDMNILAYDTRKIAEAPPYIQLCDSLQPLYEQADIISFHVPGRRDTEDYFNDKFLQQMRKPFILINTSRGGVVQLSALWQGLRDKRISGACLDVLPMEPPEKMTNVDKLQYEEILHMTNALISPHIAGYSVEALYKMSVSLLRQIVII